MKPKTYIFKHYFPNQNQMLQKINSFSIIWHKAIEQDLRFICHMHNCTITTAVKLCYIWNLHSCQSHCDINAIMPHIGVLVIFFLPFFFYVKWLGKYTFLIEKMCKIFHYLWFSEINTWFKLYIKGKNIHSSPLMYGYTSCFTLTKQFIAKLWLDIGPFFVGRIGRVHLNLCGFGMDLHFKH